MIWKRNVVVSRDNGGDGSGRNPCEKSVRIIYTNSVKVFMIYYDLLWLLIYISISIITFEFRLISHLYCFSSHAGYGNGAECSSVRVFHFFASTRTRTRGMKTAVELSLVSL
jgi:hypothetical protein